MSLAALRDLGLDPCCCYLGLSPTAAGMGDVRVHHIVPHLPAAPPQLHLRLSQKQQQLESAGKDGLRKGQVVWAAAAGTSPLQANVLFLLSSLGTRPGLYWKCLEEVLLCHCYVWPLFNGRVKGKGSGCDRSRSHLHPHEHGPGAGPCASPWEMGSLRCHQEVRCAAECPGVPVLFVLLCTEDGWWHLLALGQERDKQG